MLGTFIKVKTLTENGVIIEIGKHEELLAKQGAYYNLVKSQM